jgi:hypothetical protein
MSRDGTGADPWQDLSVENPPKDMPGWPVHGSQWREWREWIAREVPGGIQDWRRLSRECAGEWRDFGLQPGTRLRLVRTGIARRELRTAEQQTVARLRNLAPVTVSTGGRTFTQKRVPGSARPQIVDIIRHNRTGHAAGHVSGPASLGWRARRLRALLDETGTPILYTSGSYYAGNAGARITFPDWRWLPFPVRGTGRTNAMMTAVDQAGKQSGPVPAHRQAPGLLGAHN